MAPYRAPPQFIARVEQAAEAAVQLGGNEYRNALIDTLNAASPGQGRVYRRGRRRTHQASKPGDPPAIDTGRLISSINTQRIGRFTVRVGTNVHYGAKLEFGSARVAARPWVRPTYDREEARIRGLMLQFIRRRLGL